MPKRKVTSQFDAQAAAEALVRYQPELDGLRLLQQQAAGDYAQQVRAAKGTADAVLQTIRGAVPGTVQGYTDAVRDVASVPGATAAQDVTDPRFKQAIAADAVGFGRRIAEGRSAAVSDLGRRAVQTAQGRQFAVKQAGDTLASTRGKLNDELLNVLSQSGAFQAQRVGELKDALQRQEFQAGQQADRLAQQERQSQRQAEVTQRGQDLTHADRQDSLAQRSRSKNGPKYQTQQQHTSYASGIDSIVQQAKSYKDSGLSRSAVVKKLVTGRPQQQVEEAGQKLTLPALPKFPADLRMTAALDVAFDGHLSRATQKRLNRSGFKVRDLGLPSYGDWKKKQASRSVGEKAADDLLEALKWGR